MAGRGSSAAARAELDQKRQERISQLQAELVRGIEELLSGGGWVAWLEMSRRFHQYSLRNQILILRQNPTATQVAGYRAWQAMGRQVRRGEKAITVLAPITRTISDNETVPEPGERGERGRRIVGFKPSSVFDINQTDGPPLPGAAPAVRLQGAAPPQMWDSLTRFIGAHGFTVGESTDLGRADGVTRYPSREVLIKQGLPPAEAAAVLAHEAGHVALHAPSERPPAHCRGMVEVEAESFAYVVAAEHGLDSTPISFDYIAGWATEAGRQRDCPPAEIVTETAERVRQAVIVYLKHHQPPQEAHLAHKDAAAIDQGLVRSADPTPNRQTPAQRAERNRILPRRSSRPPSPGVGW